MQGLSGTTFAPHLVLGSSSLSPIEGGWDLGRYFLALNDDMTLAEASVSYIKRKGGHKAKIVLDGEVRALSAQQIHQRLTAIPPTLEVFVENFQLRFTLHICVSGQKPKTLAEKYANVFKGFNRELLADESRFDHFCIWVDKERDRRNFLWSLLERSKRDPTCVKASANALMLLSRLDSFAYADLDGARVRGAQIPRALLEHTSLCHADLTDVNIEQASCAHIDVRNALLENIEVGHLPTLKLPLTKKRTWLTSTVISPDSRYVASCKNEDDKDEIEATVVLWDLETGTFFQEIYHGSKPTTLSFSHQGNYLAVGDLSGDVYLWRKSRESDQFILIRTLERTPKNVQAIQFSSHQPSVLAAAFEDGTIMIWDIEQNRVVARVFVEKDPSKPPLLSLSPHDPYLAVCAKGQICLWNILEGKMLRQWPIVKEGEASLPLGTLFSFSTDGTLLATLKGATIQFWSIPQGDLIKEQEVMKGDVLQEVGSQILSTFCLSRDFSFLVYADLFSAAICIQGVRKEEFSWKLARATDEEDIRSLQLTPNENKVLAIGTNAIYLWKIRSFDRKNLTIEPVPDAFRYLPEQDAVLLASWQPGQLATLNIRSKTMTMAPLKSGLRPILFSLDGKLFVGLDIKKKEDSGYNLKTYIVDASTGKTLWEVPGEDSRPSDTVNFLPLFKDRAISPNNQFLALSICHEGEWWLEIWNLKSRVQILSKHYEGDVKDFGTGLTFTQDSRHVVSSFYFEEENRSRVFRWDLTNGELEILLEHEGKLMGFQLLHEDQHLKFGLMMDKENSSVCLWDLARGEFIYRAPGHVFAFSSPLLAKSTSDTLSLINLDRNEELILKTDLQKRPRQTVSELQFSADGRFLMAKMVPLTVFIVYPGGFVIMFSSLASLHIWEIGTVPTLHARPFHRFPHEFESTDAHLDPAAYPLFLK